MMGCKARWCKHNPLLHYEGTLAPSSKKWNDFKRCSKPVHEDGFCPLHYGPGRCRPSWPFQGREWERDGIHGQPYHFPHHTVTVGRKQWVEMIYTLHPQIRPVPEEPEEPEEQVPEEPEEPVTEEPEEQIPEEPEEPVRKEPVRKEPVRKEPVPEEPEELVTEEPVPVSVLEEVSSEEKIAKVLIWLDNNAEKINYKLGSELKELLS